MKRVLLFAAIAFSLSTSAQTGDLDTVRADVTLKVVDWYYAQSFLTASKDSAISAESWKITAAVLASNRQLATEVTVANLPGGIIFWLYRKVETMSRGNSRVLGDRIFTRIRAINNNVLQYHIGAFDASQTLPVEAEIRDGRIQTLRNN